MCLCCILTARSWSQVEGMTWNGISVSVTETQFTPCVQTDVLWARQGSCVHLWVAPAPWPSQTHLSGGLSPTGESVTSAFPGPLQISLGLDCHALSVCFVLASQIQGWWRQLFSFPVFPGPGQCSGYSVYVKKGKRDLGPAWIVL